MSDYRLTFWVIYDHPSDYPEHFVRLGLHQLDEVLREVKP